MALEHCHARKRACLFLYFPHSRAASRCNQDSDSPGKSQAVRNDRKEERQCKGQSFSSPAELTKVLLCRASQMFRSALRRWDCAGELRQVGLDVHKARERRHEKFE